jgi:hypothetical protein
MKQVSEKDNGTIVINANGIVQSANKVCCSCILCWHAAAARLHLKGLYNASAGESQTPPCCTARRCRCCVQIFNSSAVYLATRWQPPAVPVFECSHCANNVCQLVLLITGKGGSAFKALGLVHSHPKVSSPMPHPTFENKILRRAVACTYRKLHTSIAPSPIATNASAAAHMHYYVARNTTLKQ